MGPVQTTPRDRNDVARLANQAEVALGVRGEAELAQNQVKPLEATGADLLNYAYTQTQAVSEVKSIDGHQAVVSQITVNGKQLDVLLTEGSFNKSRLEQRAYAESLGYRLATREENRAYVEGLLAKEGSETISDAERDSLRTYRERLVRDSKGGLDIDRWLVREENSWGGLDHPRIGALYVRASAASELYELYSTLIRNLPPLGVSLLHQVVHYQNFHGYALGEVFHNFGDLATYVSNSDRPEECWRTIQSSIARLAAHKVPLDFFGVAIAEELRETSHDNAAFERAEETLRLLHNLSQRSGLIEGDESPRMLSIEEERGVFRLLAAAADAGGRSASARVLTILSQPDDPSHEKLACAYVAKLCDAPEGISDKAWIAIGKSIEFYRERRFPLRRLCEVVLDLDADIDGDHELAEETWRAATELMLALQDAPLSSGERGLPYDLISKQFVERYMNSGDESQQLLIHFLCGMTQFHEKLHDKAQGASDIKSSQEITEVLRTNLNEITDQGFGLTDNPAMVHKLKLILSQGNIDSLQGFFTMLRDLKMHALTDIMRNATDESRKAWARNLMAREFNMGGPPYVEGTEAARRHFNETMQVVDRALRDNKGFGGLAFDTRGLPRTGRFEPIPPMLVRFGLDSAEATYIVNSKDNSRFPGKGFYIRGIDPHKVFRADPKWKELGKSSPHWKWLEGGGLFGSSYFHRFNMEDFSKIDFLDLRGVEVVIPPADRRYMLDGVPYSYLFYNRHFAPYPQAALGVPSVVIHELLGNSLIDANDFRGFDPSRTDISKADFSYQGLLAACERRGLNLLDLTYGSVMGGGLCNVYLPQALPHYAWQQSAVASPDWTDSWGHIHKYFQVSRLASGARGLHEPLAYARRLHYDVMDIFRPLQDYVAARRFALSFYKMGCTIIRDSDSTQGRDERGGQQLNAAESPERRVHEYRYRMLQESYRWYHGAREQRWQFEHFPELHFAWVLDPNSLPPKSERRFHLDLATMVLRTTAGKFQLPKDGDGMGEEERAIWAEHVVPHFERDSVGWEPRFLMRNGAFSIYEG